MMKIDLPIVDCNEERSDITWDERNGRKSCFKLFYGNEYDNLVAKRIDELIKNKKKKKKEKKRG